MLPLDSSDSTDHHSSMALLENSLCTLPFAKNKVYSIRLEPEVLERRADKVSKDGPMFYSYLVPKEALLF